MFSKFEGMTIKDAVQFQIREYWTNFQEQTLNIENMNEKRRELLAAIRGSEDEDDLTQFNNNLLMGTIPVLQCADGFEYTSHDGKTLVCTGGIADVANLAEAEQAYMLVCIADELAPNALSLVDKNNKGVTVLYSLMIPFVRKAGEHCLANQGDIIVGNGYLSDEELLVTQFIPVSDKVLLTVKEAHELFNLSEKSLYDFARENPNSHTLLKVGKKILIKREPFQKMILKEAEWSYGH